MSNTTASVSTPSTPATTINATIPTATTTTATTAATVPTTTSPSAPSTTPTSTLMEYTPRDVDEIQFENIYRQLSTAKSEGKKYRGCEPFLHEGKSIIYYTGVIMRDKDWVFSPHTIIDIGLGRQVHLIGIIKQAGSHHPPALLCIELVPDDTDKPMIFPLNTIKTYKHHRYIEVEEAIAGESMLQKWEDENGGTVVENHTSSEPSLSLEALDQTIQTTITNGNKKLLEKVNGIEQKLVQLEKRESSKRGREETVVEKKRRAKEGKEMEKKKKEIETFENRIHEVEEITTKTLKAIEHVEEAITHLRAPPSSSYPLPPPPIAFPTYLSTQPSIPPVYQPAPNAYSSFNNNDMERIKWMYNNNTRP